MSVCITCHLSFISLQLNVTHVANINNYISLLNSQLLQTLPGLEQQLAKTCLIPPTVLAVILDLYLTKTFSLTKSLLCLNLAILTMWTSLYPCLHSNLQRGSNYICMYLPKCTNCCWRIKHNFRSIHTIHQPVLRMMSSIANIHCNSACKCANTSNYIRH